MKLPLAAALASAFLICTAAAAEPAPAAGAPAAAAPAPSAKALELTKRYFEVTQFRERMHTMMGSLLPVMIDQEMTSHPDIPPSARSLIVDVTEEAWQVWFNKYLERMMTIYAGAFTEQELQAAVDFYGSPVGRSITAKSQLLSPKAVEVVKEMMPGLEAEVRERMCKKIDCTGAKTQPSQARTTS